MTETPTPDLEALELAAVITKKFVKQFVEWMHFKIGTDALLDLATHSEPERVEEFACAFNSYPADEDAAKLEALTGIANCIFS